MAFALVALLSAYNLERYPRTWFDEGVFLEGAKTLARTGLYGTSSSDGVKLFDGMITTGPAVIVPVALVFKLAGVGLLQARVIAVAYILFGAIGLYRLAGQLYGRGVAVLSLLVYAALTDLGPFANGRFVLGEVPAVAFLFWGASLLVSARELRCTRRYAASGLLFGLAILCKYQLVILIPTLGLIWLVTRSHANRIELRQFIVLIAALVAPTLAWFGYQAWILGPFGLVAQVGDLTGQAGVSGTVGPFRRTPQALRLLASFDGTPWCLAALAYAWLEAARDPDRRRPELLLVPCFVTLWLGAFVVVSAGWPRYAVALVVPSSLLIAKLMYDLGRGLAPLPRSGGIQVARALAANPLGTALLALLSAWVLSGIFTNAWNVARARDDSPQRFAAVLTQTVPADAVVETGDWEIGILADRVYHRPPVTLVVAATRVLFLDAAPEQTQPYRVPAIASYLVDGPFSKLSKAYDQELARGEFHRVASVGEYDLYRRGP